MNDFIYLIDLYDIYKNLLTDKQQKYFEEYYFENYTLEEISENFEVSKAAVHKQIKEVTDKLLSYEEKLGFFKKKNMVLLGIDDEKVKKEIRKILEEK